MSLSQSILRYGLILHIGHGSLLAATTEARNVQYQASHRDSAWESAPWLINGHLRQGLTGTGSAVDVYAADQIEIQMEPMQKLSLDGSIKLRKKASIHLVGGTLVVSGQIGDKQGASSGHLTISGDSVLYADELLINKRNTYFTMQDQARVNFRTLFLRGMGNSAIEFAGGTLFLSDSNPIYGASFAQVEANITAAAGQFSIVHLDASEPGKTLAHKVGHDLFLIDGERIEVDSDGSSLSELNEELAEIEVNGKILQITEEQVAGLVQQTLSVVDIPEPSAASILLVTIVGAIVRRRERRFS